MLNSRALSPTAIVAGIVAVIGIATAAAIFLSTDDAGVQRFAMILGIVALVVPQLVGMLRGDVAANRLNGELDERVRAAVLAANYVRRTSDVTPDSAAPRGLEAVINPHVPTPPIETGDPEGLG